MKLRVPPTLLFGRGVLGELSAVVAECGAMRPLLVTDAGVAAAGLPERLSRELAAAGLAAAVWDGVAPDPDEEHAERCRDQIAAGGHDAVVAVGGGSVIDAAKVAAVLATNGGASADYFGFDRVRRPGLPLIAVPTTAGSGAEVSSHAVLVRRQPRKKEVVAGGHLLARAAVVDPDATVTLPRTPALHAALDGLIHALEAFLARRANLMTDAYARLAVPRIAGALRRLAADWADAAAREELCLGCLCAGLAMANANAGAIHALGYPLTGGYGVPHGLANALMSVAVLDRTAAVSPERYAELVRLLGDAGDGLAAGLRRLLAVLGIADTLSGWGVAEGDLPRLAEEASAFRPVLENTPMALSPADLLEIYRAAFQEKRRPESS